MHAVVLTDSWCGTVLVGVENTNGKGFRHEVADFALSRPPETRDLGILLKAAAYQAASKHQSHYPAAHVLVNAGKRYGLDGQPCLLADLASQAVADCLVSLKDSAWRFPVRVVTPLYE